MQILDPGEEEGKGKHFGAFMGQRTAFIRVPSGVLTAGVGVGGVHISRKKKKRIERKRKPTPSHKVPKMIAR